MNLKQMLKTKLLPVTAGAVVVALAAGGVAYASAPAATKPAAPAVSSSAVSYTHLDVYKRQSSGRTPKSRSSSSRLP